MRVMIIGANGQLGTDLCRALGVCSARPCREAGEFPSPLVLAAGDREPGISPVSPGVFCRRSERYEIIPLTHSDIEITDMSSVREACCLYQPDVIINTAAMVKVDDCESVPDRAFRVNALGARNAAVMADELGARLVHISTDYVFGGEDSPRRIPYAEQDYPVPGNVYGRTKLEGEIFVRRHGPRHLIIRTSGLFGTTGSRGKGGNFIETILGLANERPELRVVRDQVFSPTYSPDLARKISRLLEAGYGGIFHITNSGSCSWFELAREAVRLAGLKTPVIPITSKQYPQKAPRPRFSVLDNARLRELGLSDMRSWQEALKEYMQIRNKH